MQRARQHSGFFRLIYNTTPLGINKLYYGDNLEVLRKYIKDETVDLCYIDPPFNSKRNYNQIYNNIGKEDRAEAQAFVDTWTWDDSAINGLDEIINNEQNRFSVHTINLINGLEKVLGKSSLLAYLVHIILRVTEIQRILKTTGSFYLHCDPTASHYLKLVCDSIFCPSGGDFKNEIIWHYSGWNAILNDSFNKRHDSIFFYTKSGKSIFNGFAEKWKSEEEYVKLRKQKVLIESNGKKYVMSDAGGGNRVKRYLNEAMEYGKPISNVWVLDKINNSSKERLGYPTQKPEALLERIIEASTNKGDLVLDAYCGCGTTVAVAEKLKRKWIGIDITYQSISLILYRLEKSYGKKIKDSIELSGVPEDIESAVALANKKEDKVRKEFEKWAVLSYSNNRAMINEKKGGDGGIDGIALIQDRDKDEQIIEMKRIVFSVKSDKTLTPAYLDQLKGKMIEKDVVMGIFICLYEPTSGMVKMAKEMGTYKNKLFNLEYPKLQIVSIKDYFDKGLRLNIPVMEVVKKAEYKGKEDAGQGKLFKTTEELF